MDLVNGEIQLHERNEEKISKRIVYLIGVIWGAMILRSEPLWANQINEELKIVKVGYVESTHFCEGMSDDTYKSGYAYEYLQKVAYYSGWKYEYVYGDWSTILEMLEQGEIDLMAGVSYTESRAQNMKFPDYPMGIENYYIYTRQW